MSEIHPSFDPEVNAFDDTITAVEYNSIGDYLATGDRNGRITILKLEDQDKSTNIKQYNWQPYSQYQSHESEFDYLKSLEIEAKINRIKFCSSNNSNTNLLLSTNDKTIKLWKMCKSKRYVTNSVDSYKQTGKIELPKLYRNNNSNGSTISSTSFNPECHNNSDDKNDSQQSYTKSSSSTGEVCHAFTKKVFSNAHTYHINSLACNSDGQTFISADDLRINWWNLEINDTCFNMVDIKPVNMEELNEVITSVQFHPEHCNILAFSSSRGNIKICDSRLSALCKSYSKMYFNEETCNIPFSNKSFITDILNSISDITYSKDGRYLIARDYLTVKIWDVNMENKPVKCISLHEYLRPILYELYSSDIIFDKFEVCCSQDGNRFATGSYDSLLKIYHGGNKGLREIDIPISSINSNYGSPIRNNIDTCSSLTTSIQNIKLIDSIFNSENVSKPVKLNRKPSEIKTESKILHCTWHPNDDIIAVAARNGLCIYRV